MTARALVDEHRRMKLARLAYVPEHGLTPAPRMALKASAKDSAFDIAAAMAVETAEEVEDGGKPRDRTDDKPAGV